MPRWLAALGLISVLAAGGSAPRGIMASGEQTAIPRTPDDRTIVHVLNRLGFGPAPGDVERVRRVGLKAWIDSQLDPAGIDDDALAARLAGFETLAKSPRELARDYFLPAQRARRERQRAAGERPPMMAPPDTAGADARRAARQVLLELSQQKLLRAIYSERQLEEVLVDFWFNHFNVFAGKGPTRIFLGEYEREVIRPHALGRFRDLLRATAESPAMLFYLDNWQSAAPVDAAPAGRRRGLNENYARELLELHTLGVDGGYTQRDVQEVARAFTGWTIAGPRQGGGFRFDPRRHDNGEKVVLGRRLAPGGGKADGDSVIEMLASHPSTARHIAGKLARRFVADDPPRSLVDRAAARFTETDGDIREVVRTIVTSPEFFAPAARRAKFKTPLEFVASAIRAAGAEVEDATALVTALRGLGMPLYGAQPPTGYDDTEPAWANAGALLNRMNFAVALAADRIPGVESRLATGTPADAVRAIASGILAGELSEGTAAMLRRANRAPQAVALLIGSPDFQKR